MSRKFATIGTLCVVAVAAGAFLAGRASSEEPPAGPPGGMPPEVAEMMADMQRMSEVRKEHEVLKQMEGSWTGSGSFSMGPIQSPFTEEFTGKVVFGGRFLQGDSTSTMSMGPGMPPMTMTGRLYVGFDNGRGKYVQTMVSDMSTGLGISEGTYDAATKTFDMTGTEIVGPGKENRFRMKIRLDSPDQWTFTGFMVKDGEETKFLEAVYKRKK